ncbi:hypothetical protein B0H13DRAFT_2663806 [Mycena leptocephala]|nr:hypothetical protein B0H13DRAFT_2663806 [Mycena leptocephala]
MSCAKTVRANLPLNFPAAWLIPADDKHVIDSGRIVRTHLFGVELAGLVVRFYFGITGCIIPVDGFLDWHKDVTLAGPCDSDGRKEFYMFCYSPALFSSMTFHANRSLEAALRRRTAQTSEMESGVRRPTGTASPVFDAPRQVARISSHRHRAIGVVELMYLPSALFTRFTRLYLAGRISLCTRALYPSRTRPSSALAMITSTGASYIDDSMATSQLHQPPPTSTSSFMSATVTASEKRRWEGLRARCHWYEIISQRGLGRSSERCYDYKTQPSRASSVLASTAGIRAIAPILPHGPSLSFISPSTRSFSLVRPPPDMITRTTRTPPQSSASADTATYRSSTREASFVEEPSTHNSNATSPLASCSPSALASAPVLAAHRPRPRTRGTRTLTPPPPRRRVAAPSIFPVARGSRWSDSPGSTGRTACAILRSVILSSTDRLSLFTGIALARTQTPPPCYVAACDPLLRLDGEDGGRVDSAPLRPYFVVAAPGYSVARTRLAIPFLSFDSGSNGRTACGPAALRPEIPLPSSSLPASISTGRTTRRHASTFTIQSLKDSPPRSLLAASRYRTLHHSSRFRLRPPSSSPVETARAAGRCWCDDGSRFALRTLRAPRFAIEESVFSFPVYQSLPPSSPVPRCVGLVCWGCDDGSESLSARSYPPTASRDWGVRIHPFSLPAYRVEAAWRRRGQLVAAGATMGPDSLVLPPLRVIESAVDVEVRAAGGDGAAGATIDLFSPLRVLAARVPIMGGGGDAEMRAAREGGARGSSAAGARMGRDSLISPSPHASLRIIEESASSLPAYRSWGYGGGGGGASRAAYGRRLPTVTAAVGGTGERRYEDERYGGGLPNEYSIRRRGDSILVRTDSGLGRARS